MKNIEKLIDLLKDKKEKAKDNFKQYDNDIIKSYHCGRFKAFSFCIKELEAELLLKNYTEASTQESPISANTL